VLQADCGSYGLNLCITVLWVIEFFCNTDADQVTTQLSTFLKHTHRERAPGLLQVGYIFKRFGTNCNAQYSSFRDRNPIFWLIEPNSFYREFACTFFVKKFMMYVFLYVCLKVSLSLCSSQTQSLLWKEK